MDNEIIVEREHGIIESQNQIGEVHEQRAMIGSLFSYFFSKAAIKILISISSLVNLLSIEGFKDGMQG